MPAQPVAFTRRLFEVGGIDFETRKVTCPAGRKFRHMLRGPAVECRIEDSEITAGTEPSSLVSYCMGNYTECPTWRADREHHLAQKRLIDMNHPKRPGHTILDQDPEQVPAFSVPSG